ncbi:hypothetical protein OH76DRAFT_122119 [Lentinus brumalis]|uniref:Mid2 domain-containing protein n=1 Tax=Lentinus brumalis TaxID=2498619 RepID=A0A371DJL3_9APHY|nr:hypothetical protein OH76DRAFT_122119 [Polyporus brumalis]
MRTHAAVLLAFSALLHLAVAPALAKHGEGAGLPDDDDDDEAVTSSASTPSTSTSSAPSPSPSAPSFQFLQPGNTTTCQNVMLRWKATNFADPITITVTNDRATGPTAIDDNVLISRTLSTNVSASADQYMWVGVDVPQGLYVAVAVDTSHTAGIFSQSPPFFVQAGQDSGCLTISSASPASSRTSSPSQSNQPSPTATSSANAEPDTAQSKKLSPAVLGGVVAGVVVGVILLIFVFTFPPYWKEFRLKRARARRPGGPYYLF